MCRPTYPAMPISISPSRPPSLSGMENCFRFGACLTTSSEIRSVKSSMPSEEEAPSAVSGRCRMSWLSAQAFDLAHIPERIRVEDVLGPVDEERVD